MKTQGYSIWLIPPPGISSKFKVIIDDLARKYNQGFFDPHVTLIGGLDGEEGKVLREVKELVKKLKSFEINFEGFGMEDFFFKSLYLKAIKGDGLMTANNLAQAQFNLNYEYKPHFSLIYGDLSDEIKIEIIEKLKNQKWVGFKVDKLVLYKCDGEVSEWLKIKEFKFARP